MVIVVIIYEHNNDFGVDTILKEKKAKIYGKHSRKYEGKLVPKKTHGVYYTTGNPFVLKPFSDWAKKINLTKLEILEPFGGAKTKNIMKKIFNLESILEWAKRILNRKSREFFYSFKIFKAL